MVLAIDPTYSRFKLNERLVYVQPGGTRYLLHAPPSRVVLSEEGFGTPPIEYIVDRAPFQHGDTVRDLLLQPRPVQLVVLQNFKSRSDYWNGRAAFLDAIRPNRVMSFSQQGSLLYYLGNGTKRQLDVLLDSGPGFSPPQGGWREWSFTEAVRFTAHDPVWYNPSQKSVVFNSSGTSAAFTFPITFPVTFASFGGQANVAYLGTWLEYPTIVLVGPITGPLITNLETGDILNLDYTIDAGRTVTITLRGAKTILRDDGVNLLNYLTSDSDLATFSLQPDPTAPDGVNRITVSGTGTTGASTVTLLYYDRYFGI